MAAMLGLSLLAAAPAAGPAAAEGTQVQAQERRKAPALRVRRVVTGLDIPWDVEPIGQGRLLVTERDRARLLVAERSGRTRTVALPGPRIWVSGETGLTSLAVDPSFATNRRFYTCQGGFTAGGHDVRVMAWKLNAKATRATKVRKLIGGFPTTSGRHGGCRLLVVDDGSLLVGTGDAAVGTNPRDLTSFGGKTLRLDRFTGKPWPTNPFAKATNPTKRFIHTYGHRNVQGLAQREDGTLWSIEHGSTRDDEVNKLVKGGDYGWQPVPGYDESVPMTDQSLPGRQQEARWSSGSPTIATSGGAFVDGEQWGAYDGTLAVAALAGSRMLFLRFDTQGRLQKVSVPSALRGHGRLRSVSNAPNGDLLVTTSNGSGNDVVLRVSPR
jgi:glucose/arabinose dehydrogenase